jgi:hypothetical protein
MRGAAWHNRGLAAAAQETPAQRLAWWLLIAGMTAFMTLSAPGLYVLGIPYDAPHGPFPAKIHPGTYMLCLSWLLALSSRGHLMLEVLAQARREPLLTGYLICMVLAFVWAAGRHGPGGLAFFFDTLWMPAVAALSAALQPRYRQRNSLVALGEVALGQRLIPLFPERPDYVEEYPFRASALLGHPLSNALATIALLPAVFLMPWSMLWRLLAAMVLVLALLSFGSRASLAGLAIYGVISAGHLLLRAVRGSFSYLQLTGGLVGAVLGLTALGALVAVTGVGERIFANLTWDNSASVRLLAWDVLDHFHGAAFWFGISIPSIDAIALRVGIDPRYEAIENFWIYLLLLLGMFGFVLFVAGIGMLLISMWKKSPPLLKMTMLVHLVLASGSNTLSSKSTSLLYLVVVIQCATAFAPSPLLAQRARALAAKAAGGVKQIRGRSMVMGAWR